MPASSSPSLTFITKARTLDSSETECATTSHPASASRA
jgi:hypothetical protein